MNTLRKSFLIGLTVLGMGTATLSVQAADQARHDRAAMHERDGAGHGERMARHLAALHDKLKLSAAQEADWATFAATLKPHMAAHPDRAGFAKLTAPERLEKWITLQQEHLAAQQNTLTALKAFYAKLTPEQQKIFDDNVPGGMHGGMHERMHERMHGEMKGGMRGAQPGKQ